MSHHDTTETVWQEPTANQRAGFGDFQKQPTPYDLFMESEGVPIFRGLGVRTVTDLPMADWERKGGRGSYIQTYGTETKWGHFVVEIPAVANPDDLAKRVADAAEKENVLRVKGFVEVSAKPMRLLVQAVGPRVNHYYDRAWTASDDRRSRLVVIGLKGLDQQAIEKILVG